MPRWLSANEIFPARRTDISARLVSLRSGLRMRVVEGGLPSGGPVALLHGWGACAYSFRHAFDLLGRPTYAELSLFGTPQPTRGSR